MVVWARHEIVTPSAGACLKLGAHPYSVTQTKYRHKVMVLVKQGQCMPVTVGADVPGFSHQHLHGFCLPMLVGTKGTSHVKDYICSSPKLFKEREWVYFHLCYSLLEGLLLDGRNGEWSLTCMLWLGPRQGGAVTEPGNRIGVQVLVEIGSRFWTCLIQNV